MLFDSTIVKAYTPSSRDASVDMAGLVLAKAMSQNNHISQRNLCSTFKLERTSGFFSCKEYDFRVYEQPKDVAKTRAQDYRQIHSAMQEAEPIASDINRVELRIDIIITRDVLYRWPQHYLNTTSGTRTELCR